MSSKLISFVAIMSALGVACIGAGIENDENVDSSADELSEGTGLLGEYFDNGDLTALKVTRTDATVNFSWGQAAPASGVAADTFSVRWSGEVEAKASENVTFYTTSDDGIRLWVDNKLVIDNWTDHGATENASAPIALVAGRRYSIRLEFYENGGDAVAQLRWSSPSTPKEIIPQQRLYPPGAASSVDLALNKTTVASSVEGAGLEASLATDSSGTSRWSSAATDPQWIYVDLGAAYDVGRIKLTWETAYGRGYQLQVSSDRATWTTLYSTTTGDGNVDDVAVSGRGRYVRMNGTARGTQWGYSLWRFEVYGPGTTPPPPPPDGNFSAAFYVSTKGSDTNPGTSAAQAWRTIGRAMQQNYVAGQALLLERGGTYPGYINKTPAASGSKRWTIGAYGTGNKPVIDAYKHLTNASAWVNTGANVWRLDVTNPATHTGNTGGSYNIGHLRVGSAVYGDQKTSVGALRSQWQFYSQSPYLYVYSTSNPTTAAQSQGGLKAAPDGTMIAVKSNTEIRGLELTGSGGHGIANTPTPATNVVIAENDIHHLGGSALIGYGDNTTRYGNGVEAWLGATDWVVENNAIYEIYDAATTVQGSDGVARNIAFRSNHIHHASFSFEIFQQNGGMYNIVFEKNLCEDGGYGWGALVRPSQQWRAQLVAAATWDPVSPQSSVEVRNNTFVRAAYCYWLSNPSTKGGAGIVSHHNDIRMTSGTRMHLLLNQYTINNAAAWAASEGVESGSTFTVLP